MKTYTKEQLIKAVAYASELQKAEDYLVVGQILIPEDRNKPKEELIEETLNYLANQEFNEVTIADIDKMLAE